MRGNVATIGLIIPDSGPGVLAEHRKLLPPGINTVAAYLPLRGGEVTVDALTELTSEGTVERAARTLRRNGADCILFACTTGSLVHGQEWDTAITTRIEQASGLPALTTATAALRALHAVNARRLALITPYLPELDAAEKAFFEAAGFDVVAIGGAEHRLDADIDRLTPYDLAWYVDLVNLDEVDTVFVSCTSWRVLDAIAHLETVHRRVFVTSNQAGAWAATRLLGIPDFLTGFGTLLRSAPLPIPTPS